MTNVDIKLLGRVTLDQQYSELWTGTATVADGTTMVAPVVPPEAIGTDLIVSVLAVDGGVNFAIFFPVAPEAASVEPQPEAVADEPEPEAVADKPTLAPRLQRLSAVYGAFAGQPRRAPFQGTAIGLCAVGTPLPV